MNNSDFCPECENLLSTKKKRCSCGWFQPAERMLIAANHDCNYTNRQEKCPLPGGICPYPYAKGPWYCSGHWQALGDDTLGNNTFIFIKKNYQKIMDSKKSWKLKNHINIVNKGK